MSRCIPRVLPLVPAVLLLAAGLALPCTNILVSPGASTDGSAFVSYAADSHDFYGELVYRPGSVNAPGTLREIIEWDTGRHLGFIPEAPRTWTVVGHMNEHQVAIGETTFGGRRELRGHSGILDYGSLMQLALERATTAREAIRVIGELVAEHGYHSSGESFSISDPHEVWILEIIGKGEGEKGAVWVARRVPDGFISAHANQARIRTFPLDDPENCLHSPDVISFAREKGFYEGPDEEFSFADVYDPLDFRGIRFCEARVWSVFRRAAPSLGLGVEYADGHHPDTRLPLWIRPDRPLGVADVMALMRDHYEGTELDMTVGVDAGPFGNPNRWRPMGWTVGGEQYTWERPISTQQTAYSFVSQSRSWLPDPVGGVLWYGMDDTFTTCYTPLYCGIREIPRSFATGSLKRFSWDSAFWVFNFVANIANLKYSHMVRDIQEVQREVEGRYLRLQPVVERTALELLEEDPELAAAYLTDYSVGHAERLVQRWRELGEFLLAKYNDGYVQREPGRPDAVGYPEGWLERVVRERGERYRLPGGEVRQP